MRQQTSYLINTLGTDVSLYTKPEHGQHNETDDAEIAEPESEWWTSENGEGHTESCTDGASQHYNDRKDEMSKGNG